MALRGTLEDMPIVDLIQFAHQSRRTGVLVVTNSAEEARLFYLKGKLVRAESPGNEGRETLIQVVDWDRGEFEFCAGVETDRPNIEMDVHREVMNALKVRDERREQVRLRAAAPAGSAARNEIAAALREFLGGPVTYLSMLDAQGVRLASAGGARPLPEGTEDLEQIAVGLLHAFPRPDVRRVTIEDGLGTAAMAVLPGERCLVMLADRSGTPGAVSVTLGKLLTRLAIVEGGESETALRRSAG